MTPYVNVFPLGTLPLGMRKMILFPFGMRVTNPWDILPRSLANSFIHISASGYLRNYLYYCNIPVMVSITSLASKWIHASCAVRICVYRAYLEAVFLSWDSRGAGIAVPPLAL